MINLQCSNCKTTLAVDDAFAGGVCRCQHCGTIQKVPTRGAIRAASAPHGEEGLSDTSLGELADVAASAGLAAADPPPQRAPHPGQAAARFMPASGQGTRQPVSRPQRKPLMWLAGLVVVIAMLAAMWVLAR
jgi:hypothetical protein